MRKKGIFLAVIFVISLACVSVSARASEYLFNYAASIYEGDGSGEITIEFDVFANMPVDKIGASKITLYRDNGRMVEAITGSINNGLITTSDASHFGSHTFDHLTPGESYYAEVTVFAEDNGGSDSRVIETNSVRAPY